VATNAWTYTNSTNLTTPKMETSSRPGEARPYVWTSGHTLSARREHPCPLPSLASALPCYLGDDHNNQWGVPPLLFSGPIPSVDGQYCIENCLICMIVKNILCNVCSQKNKTRVYAKNDFLFTHTHKSMNQYIINSSVRSKAVYNRKHTNTSTSKHAIINTIVSTKSIRYTL